MALIKCKECGKEFSDKASACPQCGCPNENKKKEKKEKNQKTNKKKIGIIIVIILLPLLIGLVWYLTNNHSYLGKWNHTIDWQINGDTYRKSYASFSFSKDGTFVYEGKNIPEDETSITIKGTYAYNNGKIYIEYSSNGEKYSESLIIKGNKICEATDGDCQLYFGRKNHKNRIVINEEYPVYDGTGVVIDYFYSDDCLHCDEFNNYIELELSESLKSLITINYFEAWENQTNNKFAESLAKKLGTEFEGVPFMVINREKYIHGFSEETKKEFLNIVTEYLGYIETTNDKSNNNTYNNNITSSSNNNTNNNSNKKSNTNTTPPPISYNITSIDGVGNTYKYDTYNECRVDALTATVKEIALEDKLQVDYTITMTKTQRFDNYDPACHVKLSVYDSSNVVVGSADAFVEVELNETGRKSFWIYIDKSGTNYSIKIKETK